MKCIGEEKLWEYLDGEITPSEKIMLETHLEKCDSCRNRLEELMLFDSEISSVVLAQPSLRFTKNVMELIEVELNPVVFKPLLRKVWQRFVAFGFASMFATLVFIAFVFPSSNASKEMKLLKSGIHDFFTLTQHPLIINSVFIIIALWTLYLLDRFVLSQRLSSMS